MSLFSKRTEGEGGTCSATVEKMDRGRPISPTDLGALGEGSYIFTADQNVALVVNGPLSSQGEGGGHDDDGYHTDGANGRLHPVEGGALPELVSALPENYEGDSNRVASNGVVGSPLDQPGAAAVQLMSVSPATAEGGVASTTAQSRGKGSENDVALHRGQQRSSQAAGSTGVHHISPPPTASAGAQGVSRVSHKIIPARTRQIRTANIIGKMTLSREAHIWIVAHEPKKTVNVHAFPSVDGALKFVDLARQAEAAREAAREEARVARRAERLEQRRLQLETIEGGGDERFVNANHSSVHGHSRHTPNGAQPDGGRLSAAHGATLSADDAGDAAWDHHRHARKTPVPEGAAAIAIPTVGKVNFARSKMLPTLEGQAIMLRGDSMHHHHSTGAEQAAARAHPQSLPAASERSSRSSDTDGSSDSSSSGTDSSLAADDPDLDFAAWIDVQTSDAGIIRKILSQFPVREQTIRHATTRFADDRIHVNTANAYVAAVITAASVDHRGDDEDDKASSVAGGDRPSTTLFICAFEDWIITVHDEPIMGLSETLKLVQSTFSGGRRRRGALSAAVAMTEALEQQMTLSPAWLFGAMIDFVVTATMPDTIRLLSEAKAVDEIILSTPDSERQELLMRIAFVRQRISTERGVLASKERMLHQLATAPLLRASFLGKKSANQQFEFTHKSVGYVASRLDAAADILNQANSKFVSHVSLQMSTLSNRMSRTMKALSQVATIFLPLNTVTGAFGMNVQVPWQTGTPGNDNIWAFLAIVLSMVVWIIVATPFVYRSLSRGSSSDTHLAALEDPAFLHSADRASTTRERRGSDHTAIEISD